MRDQQSVVRARLAATAAAFGLLIAALGAQSLDRVNGRWISSAGITVSSGTLLLQSATGGFGYTTGAGGTVTQATSKATGVTLNTVTGEITMNAAALAAGTIVSFVLTNSAIAAADCLAIDHTSGGTVGAYTVTYTPAAGSATIVVRNNTAGALSEALVLRYAVIKCATS